MPTPKQVQFHYTRLRKRWFALQRALDDAHNADVIKYPEGTYNEQAPCWASWELRKRIDATTEKQRAEAFKEQCMDKIKGIY